jgi:hypothetical protein
MKILVFFASVRSFLQDFILSTKSVRADYNTTPSPGNLEKPLVDNTAPGK